MTVISWAQDKSSDAPRKVDVEVILGIDKVSKIDFAPSAKVQVGNESILTYILIPQKREIIFRGLKPGTTSVTLRNTLGDTKVEFKVERYGQRSV